jgi:hypothetical protein
VLTGTVGPRDAIGARVEALVAGRWLRRRVMPARSYLSQVELPVTIGLGTASTVERLRIAWPSGTVQEIDRVPIDTTTRLVEPRAR